MTTKKNATGNVAQAELCPKTADRRNWQLEEMASEALSIGLAVDWIVSANTLLEDIQEAAKSYPEIGKFFRDKNIPIANADWTACEMGDHISRILSRQHVLIKRMAGGAA